MSTPKRALQPLEPQRERLIEMRNVLAQYPQQQVDHLDFWYHMLRNLEMLSYNIKRSSNPSARLASAAHACFKAETLFQSFGSRKRFSRQHQNAN